MSQNLLSALSYNNFVTYRCDPQCELTGPFIGIKPGAKSWALYGSAVALLTALGSAESSRG